MQRVQATRIKNSPVILPPRLWLHIQTKEPGLPARFSGSGTCFFLRAIFTLISIWTWLITHCKSQVEQTLVFVNRLKILGIENPSSDPFPVDQFRPVKDFQMPGCRRLRIPRITEKSLTITALASLEPFIFIISNHLDSKRAALHSHMRSTSPLVQAMRLLYNLIAIRQYLRTQVKPLPNYDINHVKKE